MTLAFLLHGHFFFTWLITTILKSINTLRALWKYWSTFIIIQNPFLFMSKGICLECACINFKFHSRILTNCHTRGKSLPFTPKHLMRCREKEKVVPTKVKPDVEMSNITERSSRVISLNPFRLTAKLFYSLIKQSTKTLINSWQLKKNKQDIWEATCSRKILRDVISACWMRHCSCLSNQTAFIATRNLCFY